MAEKANREVQDAILGGAPSGGPITEAQLAAAMSALNALTRWTGMSATELWTGRDMITGKPLKFSQEDIIKQQNSNRAATHKNPELPSPKFALGEVVFSNSDRSKLKARDKLIVRADLGSGQYQLDRVCSKSGYITSTVKPAYDLYGVNRAELTDPPKTKSILKSSSQKACIRLC